VYVGGGHTETSLHVHLQHWKRAARRCRWASVCAQQVCACVFACVCVRVYETKRVLLLVGFRV